MLAIIIVLIAASLGYLAYESIPFILRKYSQVQQSRMDKTAENLDRIFVLTQHHKILLIFTVTPLVLAVAGFVLVHNAQGLISGLVIGFVVPKIITKYMGLFRRRKFQYQIVDGLMIISSALKAGMSLNQSLEVLVEEMPNPISEEFAWVVRENRMGVPLEDCLKHLRARMPIDDLGLIVSAIAVARETGGDLTEIFAQLVFTLREKIKLERKVRSLTVQGRLQGMIMSILPIAFAVFMRYVSPESFNVMLTNRTGQMLLIWAVASELIGIIIIRKLSRVEV
jgi:tight adherence protein B